MTNTGVTAETLDANRDSRYSGKVTYKVNTFSKVVRMCAHASHDSRQTNTLSKTVLHGGARGGPAHTLDLHAAPRQHVLVEEFDAAVFIGRHPTLRKRVFVALVKKESQTSKEVC